MGMVDGLFLRSMVERKCVRDEMAKAGDTKGEKKRGGGSSEVLNVEEELGGRLVLYIYSVQYSY